MTPTCEETQAFSGYRCIAWLSRILELTVLIGGVLNLLWLFGSRMYTDHPDTGPEIAFASLLELLAIVFLLGQLARLFVDWRRALLGIGRALIYCLICSFQYL